MSDPIINKVAESGLVTIDPEMFLPAEEIVVFDLKNFLFREMILKEKEFRESLKNQDWEKFKNKQVAITCSADAIIPVWAYMLVTSYLQPVVADVMAGTKEEMGKKIFLENISKINTDDFAGKRIVIKGCGDKPIGEFAYAAITKQLMPVAKSIMYGEPCSTVPVYKKK
jgi:hypothetical protein